MAKVCGHMGEVSPYRAVIYGARSRDVEKENEISKLRYIEGGRSGGMLE